MVEEYLRKNFKNMFWFIDCQVSFINLIEGFAMRHNMGNMHE